MACGGCSFPIYLQTLCCFRISCSSSLHEGYDEPEILRYENLKSVPQALTSDNLESAQFVHFLLGPATVALVVPLYRQWHHMRRSALAISVGLVTGSFTAILSAIAEGASRGYSGRRGCDVGLLRRGATLAQETPVLWGDATAPMLGNKTRCCGRQSQRPALPLFPALPMRSILKTRMVCRPVTGSSVLIGADIDCAPSGLVRSKQNH